MRILSEHRKTSHPAGDFVWKVKKTPIPDVRSVTVIGKYCPGIFSKIVGVLTLNGFDILTARSYRQNRQNTLDLFNVRKLPGMASRTGGFVKAENDLRSVLSGRLDLSLALYKRATVRQKERLREASKSSHHIVVDNRTSDRFSVIRVSASDFAGLLFRVTDAIFRCNFYVWTAKIETKGGRVFDEFYVRDVHEQKILSPNQMTTLKTAIQRALSK